MVDQRAITFVPARERQEDQSFQYEVYASTRLEEMRLMGWDIAQQDTFLRMQFMMQQRSYAARYPNEAYQLILYDGVEVGHLLVSREDNAIRLVDVAILPHYRNNGIGTFVINNLMQEALATGRSTMLHVVRSNRAIKLYERLGFTKSAENEMYIEMIFQ
ncbi:GNAT family N-acetyltransferase [Paenibacillus sp. 1011MAR3C5]|uniref:GNAT family N-acetyltransferase n=1 Tax=Paenibacillus sp. 1011MAR3C5 TaxID=1675787 RepID=UPI000E6BB758|nr:GNAT family N-acetyltransferase [Paenibacillus sp. 1011MAR3C5]RJE87685.1 GNAT family N-acetyltransferase [Paenibacillus sp. 1011MAR3C5]